MESNKLLINTFVSFYDVVENACVYEAKVLLDMSY